MIKQILLVTDGCSNVGIEPTIAATEAQEDGITVNVVGIVDYGTIGQLGAYEIKEIARFGGGVSHIVQSHELSETFQMIVCKVVLQTAQQAVKKEQIQMLGETIDESMRVPSLQKCPRTAHVIDKITEPEKSPLRIALLIDASASMKPKLTAVGEAIRDLMFSLQAKSEKSEISVFHFPGPFAGNDIVQDITWTDNIGRAQKMFKRLHTRGTTPTGPALLQVIDYFRHEHNFVS